MIRKVLVANRGEIAIRIFQTLREMDIASVAVFSEADRGASHVRAADEACLIGPAPATESYLRIDRILEAARQTGADAVHPGYGFLSENPELPEACAAAGLIFIGPPAAAMRTMGSKPAARRVMAAAGVPIVPGADASSEEEARVAAAALGYPVMLKAAAGGGGKGMRLVSGPDEIAEGWSRARSEARNAFGNDTVYLEKALMAPRHVEIQILGDRDGNLVHLFERDCSIQRRHQKVIEETPCPVATPELIARMGDVAFAGARAVGYFSAGTFEFLLDQTGAFYFLEMNTRLQVEHAITEWVTGLDLVREMVRIADGAPLGYGQADVARRGVAIECRVYAEDPSAGFLPSSGIIRNLRTPGGPGVRDDRGVEAGSVVSSYYDPLLAKVSTWAPTRAEALTRMSRALSEYAIGGVRTNLTFLQNVLRHESFRAGSYDTGFLESHRDELTAEGVEGVSEEELQRWAVAAAVLAYQQEQTRTSPGAAPPTLSPWARGHRARTLGS